VLATGWSAAIDKGKRDEVIDFRPQQFKLNGTARAADEPVKFTIKATTPARAPAARPQPGTSRVELTLDATNLLRAPLSGKEECGSTGSY